MSVPAPGGHTWNTSWRQRPTLFYEARCRAQRSKSIKGLGRARSRWPTTTIPVRCALTSEEL
eukprot:1234410-Pyramimonas_sp.AAC.1